MFFLQFTRAMKYIIADIKRFSEHEKGLRPILSNIFSLGFAAILVYRIFSFLNRLGIPTFPIRFPIEKLVEMFCGISIPASAKIGPGLRIHHFGGIVLHDSVDIGKNATIYHNVTIGLKTDDGERAAKVGDNAYFGTGAVVLGAINLGNNVTVGANAVVLKDMPDHSTAVGNPAKIIVRKSE